MRLIDAAPIAPQAVRTIAQHASRARECDSCARIRGLFLLEALLALVVFAVGTVGMLGVIVGALRACGNADWRSEASDLAASTLSRMWSEAPADLPARYRADGQGFAELLAAASRLPGVSAHVNAPVVTIDDSATDIRRISVTVFWQPPVERTAHHASAIGVLPRH
jgi:type IV pilus assembly protein PilV